MGNFERACTKIYLAVDYLCGFQCDARCWGLYIVKRTACAVEGNISKENLDTAKCRYCVSKIIFSKH